jgi:hypothetical protein
VEIPGTVTGGVSTESTGKTSSAAIAVVQTRCLDAADVRRIARHTSTAARSTRLPFRPSSIHA